MKKILPLFLTFALLMMTATTGVFADTGNGNGNSNNNGFKDIQNNWSHASIMNMHELGILQGYADGTFRPDQNLTQDEVAVILDRLLQKRLNQEDADQTYEDDDDEMMNKVPGWAKHSVLKGAHHKYINMNRYHSSVQCDRLLIAVELAKALGLEPVDESDFDSNPFNFNDRELISDEDYGYLLALYNTGYLKGYPDGNFNPNYLMSRAQMAKLLDNIFNDGDDTGENEAPTWSSFATISASAITSDSVHLFWDMASDNVKVTLYKITYKDGVNKEKYANLLTNVTVTGLTPDTEYTFTVYARDAAGNWSTAGPSVEVTTLPYSKTTITAISAITGEVRVGSQLTAGTLTPSDATANYQWLICETSNGTYAAILGETTRRYTPVQADLGKFLKVTATGRSGFTGTVTSAATTAVGISFTEIEAVDAINDATTTGAMATAITTYSVILGLNLSDYNMLSNKLPVQEAMIAPTFPDKAAIKTAFDLAVDAQEEIED